MYYFYNLLARTFQENLCYHGIFFANNSFNATIDYKHGTGLQGVICRERRSVNGNPSFCCLCYSICSACTVRTQCCVTSPPHAPFFLAYAQHHHNAASQLTTNITGNKDLILFCYNTTTCPLSQVARFATV